MPYFGNHILVTLETNFIKPGSKEFIWQDWKLYSKEKPLNRLPAVDWRIDLIEVQVYCNAFDNQPKNFAEYFDS
jgi:hypothetical protein